MPVQAGRHHSDVAYEQRPQCLIIHNWLENMMQFRTEICCTPTQPIPIMANFSCGPRSYLLKAMMVKMRAKGRLKVLDENTAGNTLSLLLRASGKRTRMVLPVTAKLISIDPLITVFSHFVYVGACTNSLYQTWSLLISVICAIPEAD